MAMMDIAIRAAARPDRRRLVYLYAALAGVAAAGAQTVWQLDENTSSGQPMQQQVLAIAGVRWPYPPG